ncbi:MAG: PilZ domain-containing protein [Terriglobales bacterium]
MALPANAALRSLLFSRDKELISLVGEVLKTLNVDVLCCGAAPETVQHLTGTNFDAIIVDNVDAPGAVAVLSAAKTLPSCEQSIGIVLAVSPSSIGLAEGARSHVVVYRPLSADRLRNAFRSALGLRNKDEEARESNRAAISIPATLRGPGLEGTLAFIINISAGGASLNVAQSVPSSCIQTIEFCLPDTKENFAASVELVWRDVQGRMGLRFASVSPTFSEGLQKWLATHRASQAHA